MMNSVVELHDSEVSAVAREGESVVVRFASVYVHRSGGEPGRDAGTGWVQPAELIIGGGSVEGAYPGFPCPVADGTFECDGTVLDNALPLPCERTGRVRLELTFTTESALTITGESAVLNLLGEARYVEDFP